MSFFLVAHHANGQVMVIAFICSFKFVLEICTRSVLEQGENLLIFFIICSLKSTFKVLEKGRQKYETKHTRFPNLRTGTLSFPMPY